MQNMPIYEPSWESLHGYRIPDWFRDAKFGIFIHWGVYSVPAVFDEWYPRRMYQKDTVIYEYHRDTYGVDFGYKDFIPRFRAEKFDPAAWAALFRKAGARYIVPVAEHHDGFPQIVLEHGQVTLNRSIAACKLGQFFSLILRVVVPSTKSCGFILKIPASRVIVRSLGIVISISMCDIATRETASRWERACCVQPRSTRKRPIRFRSALE